MQTREQYLRNSYERTKPWRYFEVSRATWYRHGKPIPKQAYEWSDSLDCTFAEWEQNRIEECITLGFKLRQPKQQKPTQQSKTNKSLFRLIGLRLARFWQRLRCFVRQHENP